MPSATLLSTLLLHASLCYAGLILTKQHIRQDLNGDFPDENVPTVVHNDHTHGIGFFDADPTSDAKADRIDRSKWMRSYDTPPVPRPGSAPYDGVDAYKKKKLPRSVDWRDRFGVNWITTVQNQGACGSCWAFATTALIESMIRIQHGTWSKRSEADLFEASSLTCSTGGEFEQALLVIDGEGIADTRCNIYYAADRPFMACGDRRGRTLRLGDYVPIETPEDTKWWLVNIGPVTCGIVIYQDFFDWTPDQGVYRHVDVPGEQPLGGHGLLIVGYDDDQEAWIVKNSWGLEYQGEPEGDQGYWLIGYGEISIDDIQNPRYGVTNIDPDRFARRFHHNGLLYQSSEGKTHRNFQAMRASASGDLVWLNRTGEGTKKWSVTDEIIVYDFPEDEEFVNTYAGSAGPVTGQPVFLESSYGPQKEVVYWVEVNSSFAHWFYTEDGQREAPIGKEQNTWLQTAPGAVGNATGYLGFVQLDNSDFTVVIRTNEGSLDEYFADTQPGLWYFGARIAEEGILQSGPALVQSNIGLNVYDDETAGNLRLATRRGVWRGYPRHTPVMIQNFWDTVDENDNGGFQLLVAAADGWVEHWQRINDDILENPPVAGQEGKWELVGSFGDGEVAHVWGLVQGSYNFALEAVVEDLKGELWHWEYTGEWERKRRLPS
ncbi:cysteine proteinase [Sporormia fimetaria CBS 119925]|uniref:Cysteine proteinase n=1 Tax=Sporormia fimetaria CBS 119925 TaxID=1340428 RepID=A0A6A6VG62_9PLEO|nr:cysteine proteinase [Sporormia fimetaria CBS 119925]